MVPDPGLLRRDQATLRLHWHPVDRQNSRRTALWNFGRQATSTGGTEAMGEKVGFRNQKLGKIVHRQLKRRGEPMRRPAKPQPAHTPEKAARS